MRDQKRTPEEKVRDEQLILLAGVGINVALGLIALAIHKHFYQ